MYETEKKKINNQIWRVSHAQEKYIFCGIKKSTNSGISKQQLDRFWINMQDEADSYFDKGFEAFVFGQEVLVEVDSFVVAAAEFSVNPLHTFPVGS